jgi:hypothetical protein
LNPTNNTKQLGRCSGPSFIPAQIPPSVTDWLLERRTTFTLTDNIKPLEQGSGCSLFQPNLYNVSMLWLGERRTTQLQPITNSKHWRQGPTLPYTLPSSLHHSSVHRNSSQSHFSTKTKHKIIFLPSLSCAPPKLTNYSKPLYEAHISFSPPVLIFHKISLSVTVKNPPQPSYELPKSSPIISWLRDEESVCEIIWLWFDY